MSVIENGPCTLSLPLVFPPSYNYDETPLLQKKNLIKIKLNKTKYSKKITKENLEKKI